MRRLVVTAADAGFLPLLRGLVRSLEERAPGTFDALACFDLGLGPEGRAWIGSRARHVVEPGWDVPVSERARREQPWQRALTVRPFLPAYFPGYDAYLWLDADCWVQEGGAVDALLRACEGGAMALVPHAHPAYATIPGVLALRVRQLEACFGEGAAAPLASRPYYNAGVFALCADAPHWGAWAAAYRRALENCAGEVAADQAALNHLLWTEPHAVHALPARCNWLCHLALPHWHAGLARFIEPVPGGAPLGILHLASITKDVRFAPPGSGAPATLRFDAVQAAD